MAAICMLHPFYSEINHNANHIFFKSPHSFNLAALLSKVLANSKYIRQKRAETPLNHI